VMAQLLGMLLCLWFLFLIFRWLTYYPPRN
jgi:hypothetical protein